MSDEVREQLELDGMFMGLLQGSKAGIEGYFYNLFGFLRRKSDFFSMEDKCMDIVKKNFDKQMHIWREDKQRQAALEKKR